MKEDQQQIKQVHGLHDGIRSIDSELNLETSHRFTKAIHGYDSTFVQCKQIVRVVVDAAKYYLM